MVRFFKQYVYPIATLAGSIIGVGFLALPYIATQVGVVVMLAYFVAITTLVVALHVMFGKICLKTPDFKRWPGFVEYYFGKTAKKCILVLTSFGQFGVLLAYLIVGGEFLKAVFSPIIGGEFFQYAILYFIILSAIVYVGIRAVSKLEFLAIVALLALLAMVFVKAFPYISANNFSLLPPVGDSKYLFLPYGAIIFSLWGTGLIPEVEEMVRRRKGSLKKIIIAGTLIPAVIYVLFTFLVVGITGQATTPSALIGVKDLLGNGLGLAMVCIGIITTFTAFIAGGLNLKKILMYDAGLKHFPAWAITCFVPLALLFFGFNSFIAIVSIVGGLLLGIDGILILLMYRKIGGRAIVVYPMSLVFIGGIIYSIIYFF